MTETAVSIGILLATGLLSLGQAWALRAKHAKGLRLFAVWAAASLTMMLIGSVIFEIGFRSSPARDRATYLLSLIAGTLALSALIAGAFRRAAVRRTPDLTRGAAALAPVHFAVVLTGGGIGSLAFGLLMLAGANW